ncbi:VOC family protein [Microbacterium sp.]|uniref:VOC family protein n=1 Tax=Microbacterium sp. TaxID=51671 RepID=UPI003A922E2A
MTQKIVPNLWFDGGAGEAGEFYATALPRTKANIAMRYPQEVPEFQKGLEGRPLVVDVDVDGFRFTLINSDDTFHPTPAISFILNFDPLLFSGSAEAARVALDATWEALSDGGTALMELGEYPFSPHYGWVQDRYGVSWQLMLTNPQGEPRPFVIPQLMFANDVEGRAAEAAEFYTSLFDDAGLGTVIPRPAGGVMFGEFRVGEQWFSMMDSDIAHEFGFTPGVSLEARCADQAEIDRLWEALSAVPDAEQCGWLVDRFGVSWQVVPENVGELLKRPGAYGRMLGMKKLVIADF